MDTPLKYTLPGGYVLNGKRYCDVYLKTITGRIEQDIAEIFESKPAGPEIATKILVKAVDRISDYKVDGKILDTLCVADRQYLMVKLSILLGGNLVWIKAKCNNCDEFFDVQVNKAELPVIKAGREFPVTSLDIRGKKLKIRVPNGKDQLGLMELNETDALFFLLKNCVMRVDGNSTNDDFLKSLTKLEVEHIESALEAISPALTQNLSTNCPECYAEQIISLNPYSIEKIDLRNIYEEVHTIASNYHWNESDILSMPRNRRRYYLNLIEINHVEVG